jgi:hypothetical protein
MFPNASHPFLAQLANHELAGLGDARRTSAVGRASYIEQFVVVSRRPDRRVTTARVRARPLS